MTKGYVLNNTGKSKHIFKRTVYPGQSVDLDYVYKVVGRRVPEDKSFLDWLEEYLPSGWEISASSEKEPFSQEKQDSAPEQKERVFSDEEKRLEEEPSKEYSTPRTIRKMTARDIYNLRLKDNPKRLLQHVTSIHKLRRALTMCKNDSRKTMLSRVIKARIKELNLTL